MVDLDAATAATILDGITLNMIRRGDDGSLVLSMDRWRFSRLTDDALTFTPEPPAPPDTAPLVIVLAEVASITWDRLKKQQERSQVRVRKTNGDLLTFSGRMPDPPGAS
jgi:hypothetical protein